MEPLEGPSSTATSSASDSANIGRLKTCFKVIHAETPEGARAIRADLEKIKLPPQYQYPRRAKRG